MDLIENPGQGDPALYATLIARSVSDTPPCLFRKFTRRDPLLAIHDWKSAYDWKDIPFLYMPQVFRPPVMFVFCRTIVIEQTFVTMVLSSAFPVGMLLGRLPNKREAFKQRPVIASRTVFFIAFLLLVSRHNDEKIFLPKCQGT